MTRSDWIWRSIRSAMLLAGCAGAALSAHAAPPAQWGTSYGGFSCIDCHTSDAVATTPPLMPPSSNIVPHGSAATSGSDLRTVMTNAGTMSSILGQPSLTDGDLNIIRLYLINVRDGALAAATSTSFGSTVSGGTGATRSFTITNERDQAATFSSVPTGNSEFQVVGGGSCPTNTVSTIAARGSCSVVVQFFPSGTGGRSGSLRFTLNSPTGISAQQVSLSLSGTGLDPTPVYTPLSFTTLSSPGFQASVSDSQTLCPRIRNDAPTGGNNLSVAFSIAQLGGTDYTNYYEVTDLSSCPVVTPGPLCSAAGSGNPISGGTTLSPGSSCTLPIKFNPAKFGFGGGTGPRNATLTVTHNAPTAGTTASYTLQGVVATTPRIGITTNPSISGGIVAPPAFASQVVGTSSSLWNEFVVSNTGTADGLDITAVNNSNPTEFALTENCVAAPPLARLSGGSPTCTIGLTFTPLAAPTGLGQRCTTITVQAAASSNGDQAVQVCGTGVPVPVPQMDVSRASIPFGNRAIGAIYLPEPLVITNRSTATANLQIGAVAIVGSGFAFVPDATSCQNKSLAAGASCTLQVQFTPNPSPPDIAYNATLTLASNDPTTPNLSVPLSATARAFSVPALKWPTGVTSLNFTGLTVAGQQSVQVFTERLTNTGPGAVDLQAVRVVGSDAASFSLSGCPTTLYDSEYCDVTVMFQPTSGGQKTAQIEVVTATGTAPALLPVQGQGAGNSSSFLTVSSNELAFGGVRVGASSAPLELHLTAGGGAVTVSSVTADAPYTVSMQSCPPPPFTLTQGADCTIAVTFTPTATSDTTAKLHIATDSGTGTVDVNLDGVGQNAPNVSGGGCTIANLGGGGVDPTLWLLVLLAAGILWQRHAHKTRTPKDDRSNGPNT